MDKKKKARAQKTHRHISSRELYLRLLGFVRPHWRVFSIAIISMVVMAATEPAFPALLKPLLDGSFIKKDHTYIQWMPIAIVGIFLVRGVTSYISSVALNWVGSRLVMDVREAMFRKLVAMPTHYYDDNTSGTLIANVAFNVIQVTIAATNAITVLVKDSLALVGLLAWMFYLNWKLTLISLVIAPVVTLVMVMMSKRIRRLSREQQRTTGEITQVLQETIDGNRVIKIFGGQQYEMDRFHEAVNWARRYTMKQSTASAAAVPFIQFLASIALAVIVAIAIQQAISNETTVGEFVSFITAMLMLLAPIKRLTSVNEWLQKGLAAAEIIFDLLDEAEELDHGRTPLNRSRGEIQFESVSVVYPGAGENALTNISLHILQGETVALVGVSGSGKTTMANLVPRFYSPTTGRILIDGTNVDEIKLADLRANIALVSQDVVLFNDTVAANIAYGAMRGATEAEIIAAADAAYAMEFIRKLPQGIHTMIGEKGMKLSGGQRQRLAIARAFLKNAPILILDEATSALDSESERNIQRALDSLIRGRTTIVIAHRLSTIEKADRIVVLDRGHIVEEGSHEQLIALNSVYANLHRIQFGQQSTSINAGTTRDNG